MVEFNNKGLSPFSPTITKKESKIMTTIRYECNKVKGIKNIDKLERGIALMGLSKELKSFSLIKPRSNTFTPYESYFYFGVEYTPKISKLLKDCKCGIKKANRMKGEYFVGA